MNNEIPITNIAVFDQNPMLALGICSLLEKRDHFRAYSLMIPDGGQTTSKMDFQIAIIDPGQTDMPPAQITEVLKAQFGASGVVGYFSDVSVFVARACLAAGIRGFLPKTASIDSLHNAIEAVRDGAIYIDATFSDLICEPLTRQPAARPRDLTDREAYVLKSVARGKSLKEIGLELALSSKTIETYKARGSTKLNLQGRRAIVEYAIRSGWVQ